MTDNLGAFVPGVEASRAGAPDGPLRGQSFAAKDIFDLTGLVTGCGNPDWAGSHAPARENAVAVQALLDAGADLVGKTITDELAYSLNGQNMHYGTPANVNAPGRIPGGSSCGSASAVAGGVVDLALGSDTGGSVRVPASYCGLYGLRPSHGRISLEGVMPLSPSFDTVGWFAREAGPLRRAGEVLLGEAAGEAPEPTGLLVAEDAFALAEAPLREAFKPWVAALEARLGKAGTVALGEPGGGFEAWMWRFRRIQSREAWAIHGSWIEEVNPSFGPDIQERFDWARTVSAEDAEEAGKDREALTQRLGDLLAGGALICLPSAPDIAPLAAAAAESYREHRTRVLSLTSFAGLARLPQVSLPLVHHQGCPVGLSLIAARGADMTLLRFAEEFVGEGEGLPR